MPAPKVVKVRNPDGSFSSERTISVSTSALNKGRETLIPTLVAGQQLSQRDAINFAVKSKLTYPSFDSPEEATRFAHERSKTGGATAHGFLGQERKKPMPSKDKSTAATRGEIEAQRRKAQAAIDKNRVTIGGKSRSLTPRERATYQRVIKRTDKLLGPVSKPRGKAGSNLLQGLRTLKAFARKVRAGSKELERIPEKTK